MRISRKYVAALLISVVGMQAKAELLLDQVPASALGFAAWQGSTGPGYEGSHFQQLMTGTNLWQRMMQMNSGQKANDVAAAQMFFSAPSVMYIQKLDSDQSKNQVVIISKVGPMAQSLVTAINADKKPNVSARQQGDLLIIEAGEGTSHSLSGGTILEQPAFKSAAAQVGSQPAAMVYMDCDKMLRAIDTIVTTSRNANDRRGWAMVSDVLGMEGFKQFVWSGSFAADKGWETQTFVAMGANRAGLPAFLDNKPLSPGAMDIIPSQAAWSGVVRFDAARFITDIREGVSRVEPNAAQQMDAGLDMGKQMMGFDIERDLAASLGDEWVYFNTATDSLPRQNMVIINTLRNPESAVKALRAASNFIGAQMSRRGGAGPKGFETRVVDGLEVNIMTMPTASPTWAIEENRLLFALSPEAIAAARKQMANSDKSANPSAAFIKNVRKGPVTSFGYFDLPRLAPLAYANVKEEVTKKVPTVDPNAFPPLEQIMPALTPANSAAWQDEAGWHSIGREPFPFSVMIMNGTLMRFQQEATTRPQ